MSDAVVFDSNLRKPTVIKTTHLEIAVVRALAAPGPAGPPGMVFFAIDGGGPDSDFGGPSEIDGGTP